MTTLVGVMRLGNDAEIKQTEKGAVAQMNLAFNHGRKGSDGKRPTQWVKASLWGKRAEALSEYLVKGQQVFVSLGEPHVESFEKRDGTTGIVLVGSVSEIELVGSRPAASGGGRAEREERDEPRREPRRAAPAPAPRSSGGSGFDDMDDDLPF